MQPTRLKFWLCISYCLATFHLLVAWAGSAANLSSLSLSLHGFSVREACKVWSRKTRWQLQWCKQSSRFFYMHHDVYNIKWPEDWSNCHSYHLEFWTKPCRCLSVDFFFVWTKWIPGVKRHLSHPCIIPEPFMKLQTCFHSAHPVSDGRLCTYWLLQ